MSVAITYNSAHRIPLASAFFMARRPVLDAAGRPAAHELVFCGGAGDMAGEAAGPSPAGVIEDVCRHGLTRILGDLPAILTVDEAALLGDAVLMLPPDRIILDLALPEAAGEGVPARCRALSAMGYRFRLRAGASPALLALAESVRIDLAGRDEQALRAAVADLRRHGKRLVAGNVASAAQHRLCAALGCDFFQGYYFTVPVIHAGRKLSPSQEAIAELLALLASEADDAVIEHSIKADPRVGLNLLRLVNTPAFSTHRIDSMRQALMVLGRNQLQRWLQMLLYAEAGGHVHSLPALGSLAATRGRLMEQLAHKLMPGNRGIADTAFTVGVMSLMDALFGMAMKDILLQMPVTDEVRAALLDRAGFHGRLLTLAEHAERQHRPDLLHAAARALRLSCEDLYLLQLAAFEWSDEVNRSLH